MGLLVLLSFIFGLFFFPNDVLAALSSCYNPSPTENCSTYDCTYTCTVRCYDSSLGYYRTVDSDTTSCQCDYTDHVYCVKKSTTSGCISAGYNADCCRAASSWSRWSNRCSKSVTCFYRQYSYISVYAYADAICNTYWTMDNQVCSIADKCVNGTVRPGFESCGSYGGEYKYCCTTDGVKHACNGYDQDGYSPLEFSSCQGGATLKNDPCCPRINGACGSVASQSYVSSLSASSPGLCVDGNRVTNFQTNATTYSWTCEGNDYTCDMWSTNDVNCNVTRCLPENGVCGSSNGGTFASTPTSNLCSSGNASSVSLSGNTYSWSCSGDCGGSNSNCSATRDSAPSYSSLMVLDTDGDTVSIDSGNRYHLCHADFRGSSNPDRVQFRITATDQQGVSDIGSVYMRLRGGSTYTSGAVDGSSGTATIPLNLSSVVDGTYNIEVQVNDDHNPPGNSGWVDTGRDFKVWDCNVDVSGGFYDHSAGGVICSNFTDTDLADGANFQSVTFSNVSGGSDLTLSASNSRYSGGNLTWSDSYVIDAENDGFNSGGDPLSVDESSIGINVADSCPSTLAFDIDNSNCDPYASNPSLEINFSAIIDQDAWFQSVDGGIFGGSEISNYVPVTCKIGDNCYPAMSVSTGGNGALISAPTINNTNSVDFSYPRNWYTNKDLVSGLNFYEKYKLLGVGDEISGDLDDERGIIMVNDDLNINNDITLAGDEFLMVLVNGDITIDSGVNRVDGVFVANNISIGGESDTQLNINGSLFAINDVIISRSYITKSFNNRSPAVSVNLRPDLLFKIPSDLTAKITNWKWGN